MEMSKTQLLIFKLACMLLAMQHIFCIHESSAHLYLKWDNVLEAPLDDVFDNPFLTARAYVCHPYVPQSIWSHLEPYFLPVNHPIKRRLDRFFEKQRATQSAKTFEEAGFGKPKMRQPTNILVGKHPLFPGYVFKVFLDTQPPVIEWDNWIKRIEGARAIQNCLSRYQFRHFRVPQKWIYPLPENPSPPLSSHYHRKNFILIAEDMHILSSKQNLKAFKKKISRQILDELYVILTEEGLIDSVYPSNIPFTEEGDLAFIDTEHHHSDADIPYHKLTPFLSTDMQKYWKKLINTTHSE